MNKLEKHIREKFEGREIKPSQRAWEKIEAALNAEPHVAKNRGYWYAIAAVFIGLMVSILFFTDKKVELAVPEIVDVEENVTEPIISNEIDLLQKDGAPLIVNKEVQKENIQVGSDTPQQLHIVSTNIVDTIENLKEVEVHSQTLKEQEVFINKKVDEVFAQVTLLESQNGALSEAEVDSLLRAAQREIVTEKLLSNDGTIDAMALLTEVEDELDQSFRDQIFEALKNGYTKLKTAVADRNN